MSKKRAGTSRHMQMDFWTALPIDECRARLSKLQRNNPAVPHSPAHDNFNTFALAHYHQLPYWQRFNKRSRKRYQLTLVGDVQATSDGTRVTLRLASDTSFQLKLETGLAWLNAAIGISMILAAGSALLNSFLIPLFEARGTSNPGLGILFVCGWITVVVLSTRGLWLRHQNLTAAAQTFINRVHDELYEKSYQLAPDEIQETATFLSDPAHHVMEA